VGEEVTHRRKDEVATPPPEGHDKIRASIYRDSFWQFVKAFWDDVPGSQPMVYNWHMEYLCGELQRIAMRVYKNLPAEYDLLINLSPGTSKSTICSILFQPWTWTFMPRMRHIISTHTDSLVLDFATKARSVIESEHYRKLYPNIELKHDRRS